MVAVMAEGWIQSAILVRKSHGAGRNTACLRGPDQLLYRAHCPGRNSKKLILERAPKAALALKQEVTRSFVAFASQWTRQEEGAARRLRQRRFRCPNSTAAFAEPPVCSTPPRERTVPWTPATCPAAMAHSMYR